MDKFRWFFCCVIWPSNDLSTTFAVDLDHVTCRSCPSCPCNHVHITPVNWCYWSQMVKSCKLRVLVNRVTFSCQITWLGLEKILCPVFWFKHALFHNVNYAFESYVWYTSGKVSGLYMCKYFFLDLAWNTGNIMMHLVMLLELVEIHLRNGHSATTVALL